MSGRRLVAGLLLAAGLALTSTGLAVAQQPGSITVARVAGTVTPVLADHITEGLLEAEQARSQAFLVELDTPGGLDASMREIVQGFLAAPMPVIVHVAPQGARAASAGAIITMSAHVAAMAPGTAIGAATPVDLGGGDISDKIINDFAAYAESIAAARGRNADFAIDAVRDGRSATADEAARIGVVDLLAPTRAALLEAIDGRVVRLASGSDVTLATKDAPLRFYELRGFRLLLQWLADPNIAFLFLSIGTLAILYELANPGIGAAGIVGAIMIVLALFGVSVLPVNAIGAIFILIAAAAFIAEVFTPGVGVFAAGGTAALLLGGLFLFRGDVNVDWSVLAPISIVLGGAVVALGRVAWRARRLPAKTGIESLLGAAGIVGAARSGVVQARVAGTWWRVRSPERLHAGQRVRVTGMDGLELEVEPIEEQREGEAS